MKRRKIIAGAVAATAAVSGSAASAARPKPRLPRGTPFTVLKREINELAERVDSGVFEQVRIDAPQGADRLLFGPTDLCTIEVNSADVDSAGPAGLMLRDPDGIRILNPFDAADRLLFGDTDDCRIEVDPGSQSGLMLWDPNGVRILNPDETGSPRILFGPTDDCQITTQQGLGLVILDPEGLTIQNPAAAGANVLSFGALDPETGVAQCRILAGGAAIGAAGAAAAVDGEAVLPTAGMIFEDPRGFLFRGAGSQAGSVLAIGSPECRIRAGLQADDGQGRGMIFEDPDGFLFQGGDPELGNVLALGSPQCRLRTGSPLNNELGVGMIFDDPEGFLFSNNVQVEGQVAAKEFIQLSSAALKENVRTIDSPIDVLMSLNGVRFDWKSDGESDIGFIAEEMEEVLPELVRRQGGAEGTRGVKYANVVAVAVEGIKAQQGQLRRLEDENAALKGEVTELRDRLEALMARVADRLV